MLGLFTRESNPICVPQRRAAGCCSAAFCSREGLATRGLLTCSRRGARVPSVLKVLVKRGTGETGSPCLTTVLRRRSWLGLARLESGWARSEQLRRLGARCRGGRAAVCRREDARSVALPGEAWPLEERGSESEGVTQSSWGGT
jgi:hypothetical protein